MPKRPQIVRPQPSITPKLLSRFAIRDRCCHDALVPLRPGDYTELPTKCIGWKKIKRTAKKRQERQGGKRLPIVHCGTVFDQPAEYWV
jgi:hypothetical protein